jgi:prepilin-type processing-associated H-X9-DG protein
MACGRYPMNSTLPPISPEDVTPSTRGFSSNHPGGAVFALADGSVRFVAETVQHYYTTSEIDSTYERLISIDDGGVLGEF